ncbi:putative hexosyltransferase [Flavobacterium saliperosum S13]|uniref:Hexosyltransferase n=1 Tax=Flavobacterium saliperosum S13 TaxID=1341155 RepID=A0ABP3A0P4_9FLAO|nr:putative hexosyltransferase [Flavobacterium saliperosum S13]
MIDYAQKNDSDMVFKWFGKDTKKSSWYQKLYNREITEEIIAEIDSFKPDLIHCFSIGVPVTPHFMKYVTSKSIPVLQSFRDYYYICPKNYMLTDKGEILTRHESALDCILHHHPKKNILFDSLLYLRQYYHKQIIKRHICYFLTPSENLTHFIASHFKVPGKTLANPALLTNQSLETKSDYLLYVGRLEKEKGVLTLLEAFKNTAAKFPNEKLMIVGSGSEKKALENYVSINKLQNVHFLGTQDRNELANLYSKAKFTIMPSEILESYGNVILESFAFKKTVIISSLLGIANEVKSSNSGLVFPFGNVKRLEEAIEKLLRDDNLKNEMETNASEFVKNRSFENHFKDLRSVYDMLLRKS